MERYPRYLLAPHDFEADVAATATAMPRPADGRQGRMNDFSGGGYVWARFGRIPLDSPARHREWNRLARQLNDRTRGIIVPILIDGIGPGGAGGGTGGIPHSDGSFFSDGSGYAQADTFAQLVGDHILNAGTLTFSLAGGTLSGGEWFSIRHPGKSWRAYRIWTIDAVDESGAVPVYTAGISPTLRAETPDRAELDFAKPRFFAQLPPGTTMAWAKSGPSYGEPTVTFVERFEVP